jgi:hypothetical protein
MQKVFLGDTEKGTVQIEEETVHGLFTPAVFRVKDGELDWISSRNVLGIIRHAEGVEVEYVLHVVARAFDGEPMKTLGPRWAAFISELMRANRVVTNDLAREAWFAANREPNELTRGATERGYAAMMAALSGELVDRIRSMSPSSQT